MNRLISSHCLWVRVFLFVCLLAAGARGEEMPLSDAQRAQVKAAEASRIAAIERVYGAVVAIYGEDRQGGGSGVLFHPGGYALTNHHVVEGGGVEGWGGLADGRLYRWKLIGTDPGGDVAVIRLSGKTEFPFAPLGDSDTVRVGDWAMAMGNPFLLAEDQRPTATLGVVSGIERFQPEAGGNMLLYGNCIQVDSSINPGNSGGPLFNLRGEVIGINGRGSFQDRGRVNVGLGYAISVNQIKHFLPELLATKVAQHGALDAVFADREAGVVCESINLDAPAADAGLKLGDKLIEFESRPIRTANQFLNLASTLPAEWPAHLVLERDGRRFEIWTRLLPLPYQAPPPPPEMPPMPRPMPFPMPGEEKIEPPAPEYPEPPAPEQPVPRQPPVPAEKPVPVKKQVKIDDPGKVQDEELNRLIVNELLSQWRSSGAPSVSQADSVWMVEHEIRPIGADGKGEAPAVLKTTFAADGRFRVEKHEMGRLDAWGFDGHEHWSAPADETPKRLSPLKALREPLVRQAALHAAWRDEQSLNRFGKVLLDGADKSSGQIAYRFKITDDNDDWFFVWLTPAPGGLVLSKAGPNLDGDGAFPSLRFADWNAGFAARAEAVEGLAEKPVFELALISEPAAVQVADEVFSIPVASPAPANKESTP